MDSYEKIIIDLLVTPEVNVTLQPLRWLHPMIHLVVLCNLAITVSVLSLKLFSCLRSLYTFYLISISQKVAANTISQFPSYLHMKELNSLELFSMERK